MWPDQVSNPGPLTYESGALSTALRGPASIRKHIADTNVVNDVTCTRHSAIACVIIRIL